MNRTLTTDIHVLPAELISDIFDLTVTASTPEFVPPAESPAPEVQTELERIANAPLLLLSRVCSRWHDIALQTPTLWSNIEIHGMTGRTEADLEKSVRLLRARLDRSGSALLSISLHCEDSLHPPHPRIFHLLAEHSHRWETVWIARCCLRGFDDSVLRGKLPRLQKLVLDVETRWGPSAPYFPIDFFAVAPRLEHLWLTAPMVKSDSVRQIFRQKQLKSFGCLAMFPEEFRDALSLLPHLPPGADVDIGLDLDHRILKPDSIPPFHLPPISTSISSLMCRTMEPFHLDHASSALTQIFASLTTSALKRMSLGCSCYPGIVLDWPTTLHVQFLAFCTRSTLGRSLHQPFDKKL